MLALATLLFATAAVAGRLLPHAPNLVPMGALALWSGVYLPKRFRFWPVLAAMLVSDTFIGFYDLRTMAVVYGSFAAISALGWFVKDNRSAPTIASASLIGATFFYLTTNFAVWVNSDLYPHTLSGLKLC